MKNSAGAGDGSGGVTEKDFISLDAVRDKNLMQLKKLNAVLFPVRYKDSYYADALASGEFTKLGLGPPIFFPFFIDRPADLSMLISHRDFLLLMQLIAATFAWDRSRADWRRRREVEGLIACTS